MKRYKFCTSQHVVPPEKNHPKQIGVTISIVLLLLFCIPPLYAFELFQDNYDWRVNWDNTLKYSTMYRLEDASHSLIEAPGNTDQDDANRNFDKGFVSHRVDLLSEFDAVYKDTFGFRVSAAAWYDAVYNDDNDHDSPSTANHYRNEHDEFTDATRDLHGRKAEILDAFVMGRTQVGSQSQLSGRLGRFAQLWGETLFFGSNGIAGAMAPMDVIKLLSVPGSTFKEIIRPLGQASMDYVVNPFLSFSGYYQFEWEHNRIPAVGSYFSDNDLFIKGGERFLLPGAFLPDGTPLALYHGDDMEGTSNPQFGVGAKFRFPGSVTTFGLYALRYNDKNPQVYLQFSGAPPAANGSMGTYHLAFPEKVWAVGGSASRAFGNIQVGFETSYRFNAPLNSDPQAIAPGSGADNDDDPAYAVGETLHANLSAIWSLPQTFLFKEGGWLMEFAYNSVARITDNKAALDPRATTDALGFRMVLQPTYRQVYPGLDLDVPIGFAYNEGRSGAVMVFNGANANGPLDLSIGLNFTYLQVWKANFGYTHYLGDGEGGLNAAGQFNWNQVLKDRDFISFAIQRTF